MCLIIHLEGVVVRITKIAIAALVMSLFSAVVSANGKIVAFDPQGAAMSTNLAKSKFDALQKNKEFTSGKAKLDAVQADMKALQDEFKKDGMTWSEQKRTDSERKMQNLRNEYEVEANKLRQMQQSVMQEVMEVIAPKMDSAIKKIIDEQKIGMVVNANAVIAVKPEHNITAAVADALNSAK